MVHAVGDHRAVLGAGDVAAGIVPGQGLSLLEVGLLHAQAVGDVLAKGHEHGVVVAQQEAPAGAQQRGYHPSPGGDVRQPAQHAQRGVHQVEVPGHRLAGVVDVGLHVLDARGRPCAAAGDVPGPAQRFPGQVDADHAPRPQPGQAHRVGAQVALEVDDVPAGQVTQALAVLGELVAHGRRVGHEALDAVAGGLVEGGPVVPVGAVVREPGGRGRGAAHGREYMGPVSGDRAASMTSVS